MLRPWHGAIRARIISCGYLLLRLIPWIRRVCRRGRSPLTVGWGSGRLVSLGSCTIVSVPRSGTVCYRASTYLHIQAAVAGLVEGRPAGL